jgi:superoxide reductase
MRIEENGSSFYRYAVQIAKEEEAKEMFNWLAGEEDKHKIIFQGMLSKIEMRTPPESYPGEYGAYLHEYADNNLVFKREVMDAEMARITDTLSAIDFAIRRELDSTLYYREIKGFIAKDQHESIDKIINAAGVIKVKVGDVPHPMEEKHYIEWIEVISDGKVCRQFLKPGNTPEAGFHVEGGRITVREYCNLHGLWKSCRLLFKDEEGTRV